jgi:hypothetical protein
MIAQTTCFAGLIAHSWSVDLHSTCATKSADPTILAVAMVSKPGEPSGVMESEEFDVKAQAGELLGAYSEKRMIHDISWDEEESWKFSRINGWRWKLPALVFVGCCVCLRWMLTDCTPTRVWKEPEAYPGAYQHLIKNAVASSSAASTPTGVLQVFQVYQPVLAPQGAVDETVLSDGQESTTTIASASSSSSCEVVLMDHEFAYSYGIPFVGMYTIYGCLL